jgi:hypothetical protein
MPYLSDSDLAAIRTLFHERYTASITVWTEPGNSGGGLWLVSCPDHVGTQISQTGQELGDTIARLLADVNEKAIKERRD